MDLCATVLMAFPTEAVLAHPEDKELYETAVAAHLTRVEVLFKEYGVAISAHALQLLEVSRSHPGLPTPFLLLTLLPRL